LIGKKEPSIDEDGNERWNSTSKVPLHNDSGELVGIVGVTRDVTEGKWVEEALCKSEENLAHAQRIARLGSWEWNALDLAVIVEGVEAEKQLTKLKEIGCEMVQGYYLAKPLPSEAVETLLLEGLPS
jgi:PAS domain-containing protein